MRVMKRLDNKVAIITGNSTGIGKAIAHKFAQEGAAVIVNGLPDDHIEDVVQSIQHDGGKAIVYAGDVSQKSDSQGCVQSAITNSPPAFHL
jgi:NAD(P)-dependent dehydrogenase (short-subunit alcohol dehydrogenase family)